jgi:hypothetical protein
MKVGDRVASIHFPDEGMTIKKITGNVYVADRDTPTYSKFAPDTPVYTAIGSLENLIPFKEKDPQADLTGSNEGTVDANIQQLNLF